jgi:nitrite reductase (NAD(P)H)
MAPVPTEVKYEDNGNGASSSSNDSVPDNDNENLPNETHLPNADTPENRKKCVVVGLGMVGIAFIEKLLKFDIDGGRDEWEVVV